MSKRYRGKLEAGGKIGRQTFGQGLDLLNKKYGMLTVRAEYGRDKGQNKIWECVCDCGGIAYVTTGNLRSGNSRSCGCQQMKVLTNSPQRERSKQHLQSRLDSLTYPATLDHIALALFSGDNQKATKWASQNAKAGHLIRIKRGVYIRAEHK